MTNIVIIGGGPAGYEPALVAEGLGAHVTLIDRDVAGGACVLYDCVPSKTFIASSEVMTNARNAQLRGVAVEGDSKVVIDVPVLHKHVKDLAAAQSADIKAALEKSGVNLVHGSARLGGAGDRGRHKVEISPEHGDSWTEHADVVLMATGASPRIVPGAEPDGERILTWRDVYDLPKLPDHLIVIGSGVTGAEFASAYNEMGVEVTLISSRDRVLPHEDGDAAQLIEDVFTRRGMKVMNNGRASTVVNTGDGVRVDLEDGRVVEGSHCLMTVGSVPNTKGLGLAESGVETDKGGFVSVDRVSRTNVPGIYAAGDCTGLLMLASVAAMQGRIAMAHALGEAVQPLKLKTVSSNIFTHPEIATVGIGERTIVDKAMDVRSVMLPLGTGPRAKMAGLTDGFVKLFCRPQTGAVIGGVIVAPYASELILPITMAVQNNLTVSQIASTLAIYPSFTGSITEAARQLVAHDDLS
ncbi:NAD(P)H-quinone dehydrogenase [Antricoccus suffuscus]|uniref:NAD(P)H-quinone dehydrogenase n=1 Tax=Antricoccus suffuscus TaxID=1629062 RepID=UPI000D066ACE|nr:NAD(P)H-quinone dehydrogenase [Antricoccus suffuscus]